MMELEKILRTALSNGQSTASYGKVTLKPGKEIFLRILMAKIKKDQKLKFVIFRLLILTYSLEIGIQVFVIYLTTISLCFHLKVQIRKVLSSNSTTLILNLRNSRRF